MKFWAMISAALLLVGVAALSELHPAFGQADAGWIALFDGKNLDNWKQIGNANWRLEDGAVVADKGDGFLVSKKDYADFQLRAEFWVDADANSGIFIRCTNPEKMGGASYEVNIWDTRPDPSYGTGAIVNLAKVNPMPRAAGKWNCRWCAGRHVREWTNRAAARTGRQGRQGCRERPGCGQIPQGGNQADVNGADGVGRLIATAYCYM